MAVTAVGSQLAHQLTVDCSPPSHGDRHPHGRSGWDVLEWPAVAAVVLVAQVGAAGVVAGPGAAVLGGGLVTLATHGLGVAVCRLVATAHTLPLPQSETQSQSHHRSPDGATRHKVLRLTYKQMLLRE